MAGLVIVLMLAIGWESQKYSMPVDEFIAAEHRVNTFVRLDGVVEKIEITSNERHVMLCQNMVCILAIVPNDLNIRFSVHDKVMMAGDYRDNVLNASEVVRRCHD